MAVLACFCLLTAACPVRAEEEAPDDQVSRFGDNIEVTRDADGHPVLINGFPFRTESVTFFDKGQSRSYDFSVEILDYPFWRPSTVYDGNLAVMSLAMALSASRPVYFTDAEKQDTDRAANLEAFLSGAGFSDIRTDDYSKETSMYTVSTGIGSRLMEADGQEPFTLIAVGICGSNYKNEWQSNVTPGNGDRHEGFDGASRLVVDRLAGYIATRGIRGKIKVWIAGFSRAAAITNLTAASIADAHMFEKEDIYAYTFATPAAVRNPPETGYEHIFNIICPTDLIPQTMPSDWNYGRYGTDFCLAVPEFSSFLGSAISQFRAEQDESLYHVINQYSPQLNFRTRLLYALLLDFINNQDYFNKTFQPVLVGIMQNKTIPSTLSNLRNLMLNLQDSDRGQTVKTDALMDYFMRVYFSTVVRSGLGANDRNSASALYRLLNEHNENSYLANMEAIRNAVFESSEEACYVMIRGPVTVSLFFTIDPENPLVAMTSDGKILTDEQETDDDFLVDSFYFERCGNTTVLAVPRDSDYTVKWAAEKDGTVECLTACISVRASAAFPGFLADPVRVHAGDTGTAFLAKNGRIVSDGLTEKTFGGRELAAFANIASLGIGWRLFLILCCALAGLVLTVILCLVLSRKETRRKQYPFSVWFALCVFVVSALESEVAFWFFADILLMRIIWKMVLSASLLFLFFRVHPPERPYRQSLFPGLLLAMIADIVFSLDTISGMVVFLLCHVVLILHFLRCHRMSRRRWLQWGIVALPLTAVIAFHFAPSLGAKGWAAAVYAPVLLLMAFSASEQPRRIRAAAVFLLVSDLLLGLYATLLNDPTVHMIYMGLFDLALLLLTVSMERNSKAKTEQGSRDG